MASSDSKLGSAVALCVGSRPTRRDALAGTALGIIAAGVLTLARAAEPQGRLT